MNKQTKPIVILGGMGPDASVRLVSRIVELSREIGGAENSDDYPNFVMQNIPVPDFFDNPSLYKSGLDVLKNNIKKLEKLDPQYFAIACNTVHSVLPELKKITKIPFLNLPEIVATQAEKSGFREIGLLATPLTYKSRIYEAAFNKFGISVKTPNESDKKHLGEIVHLMLKGNFSEAKDNLLTIVDKLANRNPEAIVLGCTELPLIFPIDYKLPQMSSIDCLATDIVTQYYV